MLRQLLAESLIVCVLVSLLIGLTATAGIPTRRAAEVAASAAP